MLHIIFSHQSHWQYQCITHNSNSQPVITRTSLHLFITHFIISSITLLLSSSLIYFFISQIIIEHSHCHHSHDSHSHIHFFSHITSFSWHSHQLPLHYRLPRHIGHTGYSFIFIIYFCQNTLTDSHSQPLWLVSADITHIIFWLLLTVSHFIGHWMSAFSSFLLISLFYCWIETSLQTVTFCHFSH